MKKPAIWLLRLAAVALLVFPLALARGQPRVVRVVEIDPPRASPEKAPAGAKATVEAIEPDADEARRIEDLIEMLGAPRMAQRDRAMAELARFEGKALGRVRQAAGHQDDEIANRCVILEEVIQSGQAELYLAARRLNLEQSQLEVLLNASDVAPLLAILRTRAEAGMVPVWARVLVKLSERTEVYPAAELCLQVEGHQGYGEALVEAARHSQTTSEQAVEIADLVEILPPESAPAALLALTHCARAIGGAAGAQVALNAAAVIRGSYPAAQTLAALQPVEDASRAPLDDAGRQAHMAFALHATPSATEPELKAAALPQPLEMSPLVLGEYLSLLARSGMHAQLEGVLVSLATQDAPARMLSTAGAAWGGAVPMKSLAGLFDSLPLAAQLAALDALWLTPREPRLAQPFLLKLLQSGSAELRPSAARILGQYRAASTARALAEVAASDAALAPTALRALTPMADLLPADVIQSLLAMLPAAEPLGRPLLVGVLVAAGAGRDQLLALWRSHLPQAEAMAACRLLSTVASSAAGAYARAVLTMATSEPGAQQLLAQGALATLRQLLQISDEDAFALLDALAADPASESRRLAAAALALAGRDGAQIGDWIARLAGEVPDDNPFTLQPAVGLSGQQAAHDYRARILAQGVDAPQFAAVLMAVRHGRDRAIGWQQLVPRLFDTPATARRFLSVLYQAPQPLPDTALRSIGAALLFTDELDITERPPLALYLADSGVDVLELLFRDEGAPVDASRALLAAVAGEPVRAREILQAATDTPDGANYFALRFARAWLGMESEAAARHMQRYGRAIDLTRVFGLRRAADAGSVAALRSLLDEFSSNAPRVDRSATAGVRIHTDQWRSVEVLLDGAAEGALSASQAGGLSARQVQRHFVEAVPDLWNDWWTCRRGLLEPGVEGGTFQFAELP